MAGSVVDAFVKTVTGAVKVGRDVGGRAAGSAGPRLVSTVEAVRSRLTGPHPSPATEPTPESRLPKPSAKPSAKAAKVSKADKRPGTQAAGVPTPAEVAKNIAPHDPATDPVIPKPKPARKSAPGAKLPAPKKS
jgi:hypothetical protein